MENKLKISTQQFSKSSINISELQLTNQSANKSNFSMGSMSKSGIKKQQRPYSLSLIRGFLNRTETAQQQTPNGQSKDLLSKVYGKCIGDLETLMIENFHDMKNELKFKMPGIVDKDLQSKIHKEDGELKHIQSREINCQNRTRKTLPI